MTFLIGLLYQLGSPKPYCIKHLQMMLAKDILFHSLRIGKGTVEKFLCASHYNPLAKLQVSNIG